MSWELKRFGDVAQVVRGVTYQKPALLLQGHPDGIPLLRATNVQDRYVDYEEPVTVPRSLVKDNQFLQSGDILIASSSGSESVVGKSAKVVESTPATFGAFCTLLRATSIDPDFLAYFVSSTALRQRWRAAARGSNINNLKASEIAQTEVPVPPLDEQKRIVAQLEDQLGKLEAVRAGLREVESFLDSLDRASLDSQIESAAEASKTERVPLGDLVHEVRCSVNPSADTTYELWAVTAYANGKPDVISGSDIKSSKLKVSPGDILLSKINPRINRVWKVKPSTLPQIASTEWLVCQLKDPDRIQSDFLLRFLQSPRFRNWLTASASSVTGSHSRAKSKEILKQLVPVPPLDVQQTLVGKLLEIEDVVQSVRRGLEISFRKLESARSSILHRAFLAPEEAL